MTVTPVPGRTPMSLAPAHAHALAARWAVGLAAAGAVPITTPCTMFAVAYAIGGSGATADNWVGFLVVQLLLGGLFRLAEPKLLTCGDDAGEHVLELG